MLVDDDQNDSLIAKDEKGNGWEQVVKRLFNNLTVYLSLQNLVGF